MLLFFGSECLAAILTDQGVQRLQWQRCNQLGQILDLPLKAYPLQAPMAIDPEMAWRYKLNIKPKVLFSVLPINELLTRAAIPELFELDILDGSPRLVQPSAWQAVVKRRGGREEKHFREGKTAQVLPEMLFLATQPFHDSYNHAESLSKAGKPSRMSKNE